MSGPPAKTIPGPAGKPLPPGTVVKPRPEPKAQITVAKMTSDVKAALDLQRKLVHQIDERQKWAKDPEENGKLYLAHWALALEAHHRPKWDDAVNADAMSRANRELNNRKNEEKKRSLEIEETAEKLVHWLETRGEELQHLRVHGAMLFAEIIQGLGETKAGTGWLRKQVRDRATSLFGKLASPKAAELWPREKLAAQEAKEEELEKQLERPEQFKRVLEASFLEVLGEATASIFEEAHHAAGHKQPHGEAGLKLIAGLLHERFAIVLSVREETLHLGVSAGSHKPQVIKVCKIVTQGEALKLGAEGGELAAKGAGLLLRCLAWANLAAKLYAFRSSPHKLVAALNVASSAAGVLQTITECKAFVDHKFPNSALPRVRSLACVDGLAKAAGERKFLTAVAGQLGKGFALGAFVSLCDVATGSRMAWHNAQDQRYGEAAAQAGLAASGMVAFIGFCLLVPGPDVLAMGLIVVGGIGGMLSTFGIMATAEDPMHAWVRHSHFGSLPNKALSIEKQIEQLHELLYRLEVKQARVDGVALVVQLEVTNLTVASKISAHIAGDEAGKSSQWHDLHHGPLRQDSNCKFTFKGEELKGIDLHFSTHGKELGQLRIELKADVFGDGSTVVPLEATVGVDNDRAAKGGGGGPLRGPR